MQNLLRLSPFQAGIAMLIPSIVLILGTEATEILIKRLSSKTLVVAGVVLVSMGNLLMSNCKMETSIVTVVIFVAGLGCMMYANKISKEVNQELEDENN